MKVIRTILVATMLTAAAASASAEQACNAAGNVEEFQYSWRLRGGVRFLAGLMFPTSGVGNLKTTFGNDKIHSELLITAPNGKQGGYYAYESDMDQAGGKTLMTYHGYAWGTKSRTERTVFDYVKGLARISKETPDELENKVKKLPEGGDEFRDVLTAIYYLRQNAPAMTGTLQTSIYSDGKEYPVVFRRGEQKSFTIDGRDVVARSYYIADAPGGRKWPGGVTVWLTGDDRRIPVRIEIEQSLASMQLDLKKTQSCSSLMARL
jgi:hypothetical protein